MIDANDVKELVEAVIDMPIAVTYVNEEDSVGDYACCGNVSYAKHKDDCQLMKAKRLANKIKSQL